MPERACAKTGLWLVPVPIIGYRVASESYGALDPRPRGGGPRSGWNRYDTIGSTVYVAQTPTIAFLEMLSAFQLPLGKDASLQKDADALGITLKEFLEVIEADWDEQGFRGTGYIPPEWANKRNIYRVQLTGPGWWVDIENPSSLAAVRRGLGDILHSETGLQQLTTSDLRGENREVTTRIASWARAQVLDDGSQAVGLRFGSKHGGGFSWAYWLRRRDDGLGEDAIVADMGAEISASTPGFAEALALMDLKA